MGNAHKTAQVAARTPRQLLPDRTGGGAHKNETCGTQIAGQFELRIADQEIKAMTAATVGEQG